MLRFFKKLSNPVFFNQAALKEVQQTFSQVQLLQKDKNEENLTRALLLINDIEKKHPFCFDTARYYRSELRQAKLLLNSINS